MQLDELARRLPEVIPVALQSLSLAVQVDPTAADLVSRLYGAERAAGRCEDAAATGQWLVKLVPRSPVAREMVALPCP